MARWFLLACVLACCAWSAGATSAAAQEPVSTVVALALNGEAKGDFFVYVTDDGDYLLRHEDLAALGVAGVHGQTVQIEGEGYWSLRSVTDIQFKFDEKTLTLDLRAAPALLGMRTVDLLPARHPNVVQSQDSSAFLNYRAGYVESMPGGAGALRLDAELGASSQNLLFLNNFSHTESGSKSQTLRLKSSLTLDQRDSLQRLTVGDFFTRSGDLGRSLNLGGVSISKQYSIDPYLIRQPMYGFAGALSLASEVDIYLDGVRVRTEQLPPGEFQVENLNYYGGARNVQIVIRDPFGREQTIDYQYYFSNTLLRRGLQEYSYDWGVLRQDYGLASNHYGAPAASFFHRYGASDALTLGLQGQMAEGRLNLGPQAVMRLAALGTASVVVYGSGDQDQGKGLVTQFGYGYQARRFNLRALARAYTAHYLSVGDADTALRLKLESSTGAGYSFPDVGNFGVDYSLSTRFQGTDRRSITLSYSRSFWRRLSFYATLGRVHAETRDAEVFLGLTYVPAFDVSVNYFSQEREGSRSDTLQLTRNTPIGEGWGYRVSADRLQTDRGDEQVLSPFVQYNGSFASYAADCRSQSVDTGGRVSSCQASVAGAVAFVGDSFGFSRPIYDSFALVKVGELEGVRVLRNNQLIGSTDASGKLFVPDLNAYIDNQISINDSDVPIDYSILEKERFVSPPQRGGAYIEFGVSKIRAIGGRLKIRVPGPGNGQAVAVEYHEITLPQEGGPLKFPTGRGGEFYLENIAPGVHPASFEYAGKSCTVDLRIPDDEEMFVDLGEVICEAK